MNMFKKNGGFTLVELIVVIAILAILAGVAVPAYSGYIKKAKEANDFTQLDAVKTAAVFDAMEQNPTATVNTIEYTFGEETATVTCTVVDGTAPTSADLSAYLPGGVDSESGATDAKWTSTSLKWELDPEA